MVDYPTRIGIILNSDRVDRRHSNITMVAVMAAMSGEVDYSWFESQSRNEEEAIAMHERHKANKAVEMTNKMGNSFNG